MIYRFGTFELDLAKAELRASGTVRAIEPQVFALLALLVENHDRLVTKDEILEKIWEGRVVSEAAVASRIKSARQALGDDGKSQGFIKTLHGQGFRFVATVRASGAADVQTPEGSEERALDPSGRPSLAVLPFRLFGDDGRFSALGDALPAELIGELTRLRWLLVTARGSSFRLRTPDVDARDVGRLLQVRYCLTGSIELSAGRLTVSVELANTTDGGVVWAERFSGAMDDIHGMRARICTDILGALELQIPAHEAARARHRPTENLDAWAAYHLGLQHLYRFNTVDHAAARTLFERAVTLDPYFARAHAGLSFLHFQAGFMRFDGDVTAQADLARRHAERGLALDALDPFVNFTMGRSFWLSGDLDSSHDWLTRATTVSPHYAQGIYALGWTEVLLGRTEPSRAHADLAMRLSPLDPLYYAMLSTRAFTHMALHEDAEAARWAEQGARSYGAHVLVTMIAAVAHDLNGDAARAMHWADAVRRRNADMTREHFGRAFPIQSEEMRSRVQRALTRLGF